VDNIKKGQKVWVSLRNGIKETIVKSVGPKYVTVEYDSKIRFDRKTLRKAGSYSSSYFIIVDMEKYENDRYIKGLIDKIKNFKWEFVDKDDLEKVINILNKY
jgi:hypothetical protein